MVSCLEKFLIISYQFDPHSIISTKTNTPESERIKLEKLGKGIKQGSHMPMALLNTMCHHSL